jgi:GDP-L-fucose synthase
MFWKDKKVLVAGGTGLVGRQLVPLLVEAGASVYVASLDEAYPKEWEDKGYGVVRHKHDLCGTGACKIVCEQKDFVFNLTGTKGSPKTAKERPADFFFGPILCSLNLMEAARRAGVGWFLQTSSIGAYGQTGTFLSPGKVGGVDVTSLFGPFREEDLFASRPSPNDYYPGWAKRVGEMAAEALKIQYGWDRVSVVRPASVYGPHDNFDPETAMVVPALIARAFKENPLKVWGDGTAVRDFVHARDVARGMMTAVEKKETRPVNLGSGTGTTVKDLVSLIVGAVYPGATRVVDWDTSKPTGDPYRVLDISRARELGWEPQISLGEGIAETVKWYAENKGKPSGRYDVFAGK